MSSHGIIVTAVGTWGNKEVIATQAITFLYFPRFLCLSPRRFLSSPERDSARRRLLVPESLSGCGGTASKTRSTLRAYLISYYYSKPTIVTGGRGLFVVQGRGSSQAPRPRVLSLLSDLYALSAALVTKCAYLDFIINLNPSNIQG